MSFSALRFSFALLAFVLLAPPAFSQRVPATPSGKAAASTSYQVLNADLATLRQQFNQDIGQIRILMLLSPT